jgi:hypothetical protein
MNPLLRPEKLAVNDMPVCILRSDTKVSRWTQLSGAVDKPLFVMTFIRFHLPVKAA